MPLRSRITSIKKLQDHQLEGGSGPHPHKKPKDALPGFNAKQLGAIYDIASQPASRVGIAVIELSGGWTQSDLDTYWSYLGLPVTPNVVAVSVDGVGNNPGDQSGADGEVTLDIQVIGGICPNSNIYVYFAPNTNQGFYDAIAAAVNSTTHPVSVVSISWGSAENEWPAATLQQFNTLLQTAAQKGITVCVAAGDNGSSDGEKKGQHADFPASSPWVLACGGTNLVCPDKVYDSQTKEVVWNEGSSGGATGGGYSTVFPKPSYQSQVPALKSQNYRGLPDVSGDADPETGWIIYLQGQYTVIGGTSAVAPMWAAYLASIGCKVFVNPVLYSVAASTPSAFHDITSGNNGAYKSAIGWDLCTGYGSPNGSVLTAQIQSKVH